MTAPFDVLRIPAATGIALLDRLLADPTSRQQVGDVVLSALSDATYWPLAPGDGTEFWRPPYTLLPAGTTVAMPQEGRDRDAARWLNRVDYAIRPTDRRWLATALNTPGGDR